LRSEKRQWEQATEIVARFFAFEGETE